MLEKMAILLSVTLILSSGGSLSDPVTALF
jgi:hypothetical protein